MTEQIIQQKLNILADYQAQADLIDLQRQELIDAINAVKQEQIDAILTPELLAQVKEIEAEAQRQIDAVADEFLGRDVAVNDNIACLTAEVKELVITHGASVKGDHLHAIFAKGRVSWDTKRLEGYAKAHPELLEYRKQGEPSVSIRKT